MLLSKIIIIGIKDLIKQQLSGRVTQKSHMSSLRNNESDSPLYYIDSNTLQFTELLHR